jgi:hypothetical protein
MRTRTSSAIVQQRSATLAFQALILTLAVSFGVSRLDASPFENLSLTLLVVLAVASVLCAWAGAAIVALGVYVIVSLDDVRELASAAVHASAPAMWMPAAVVLLSARTAETTIVALVVVANTIRLLVSRAAPQTFVQTRRREPSKTRTRLFRYATGADFSRETVPAVAGAFALQAAAVSIAAGYQLLAAVLVAIASGTLTSSAVQRGAQHSVCQSKLSRTAVGAIIAFVVAASLSLEQFDSAESSPLEAVIAQWRLGWERLAYGPPAHSAAPVPVTALVKPQREVAVTPKDLVPGVILRPHAKVRPQSVLLRAAKQEGRSVLMPLVLPFTGEYHLFPTSSGQVQDDSVVYRGTPLDAVYRNVAGGPIETEAYQQLLPAIDFTTCQKIRVTLRHREVTPALATLQLIRDGGTEELGSEVFGVEQGSDETLEFPVPFSAPLKRVTGIRVKFRCDPSRRSESAKVAVLQFSFIPRSF